MCFGKFGIPELNPDQSIVSEEIDNSKILIHIAQLVKNCFSSCKVIQFYTMSFQFFSSGFDKKKTSKISHCGSQCETLSCLCTYPVVVVVVVVEKEPKKRKKICPYARRSWYVLRCALHIEARSFLK